MYLFRSKLYYCCERRVLWHTNYFEGQTRVTGKSDLEGDLGFDGCRHRNNHVANLFERLTAKMSIIYACVAYKDTILAEHSTKKGNFTKVVKVILEKISPTEGKMTYTFEQ